jgi:hypothetical protein
MYIQNQTSAIKQVGLNGQISLGKKYAGTQIQISTQEDGTIIIKPGIFVPDNEKWLYTAENQKKINAAIKWAQQNSRSDNFAEIARKLDD